MNDPKATPGARLKAEREQRGLSAQKAADEMHLDAWVIDALEAGDYARIGPTVYAKGHLRKYASMLDLPVTEIMADFEPAPLATPSREVSKIPVGSRHGQQQSPVVSPGQAAASLTAVILLIGVMWWQPWHQRARTATNNAPPAASAAADVREPNAVDEDASDNPAALIAGGGMSTVGVPPAGMPAAVKASGVPPLAVPDSPPRLKAANGAGGGVVGNAIGTPSAGGAMPAGPSAAVAAASGPGTGRARLRLSFSSDSWVDVRDALGNRTFTGNGSANTVKTIAGNAPLHVYLRSANGVQLEINGRAVAIGSQFFSGDAARFEAGADGVLRRDATLPAQSSSRPPG